MTPESRIRRLPEAFKVWELDLSGPDSSLLPLLSPEEKERADIYREGLLRDRFILRRGLARMILGSELELAPEAVPLARGHLGQPLLPGWFVSLSSSEDFGLVALALRPIGVDIQIKQEFDFKPLMADHFSVHEQEAVLSDENPLDRFYEHWTRKEATSKVFGHGLADGLLRFPAWGHCYLPEGRVTRVNMETREGYESALAYKSPEHGPGGPVHLSPVH